MLLLIFFLFSPIEIIDKAFPNIPLKDYFPLNDGTSDAQIYEVHMQDASQYVLRLQDSTYTDWVLTAMHAGREGIAPKILWVSEDSTALMMEFLSGHSLSFAAGKDVETIKKVAKVLQKAHAIPAYADAYGPFFEEIVYCYEILEKWGKTTPDLELIMKQAYQLHEKLPKKFPRVTVHGDLNARNIYLTPRGIRLIDWAETFQEDPYFDLSYYAISFDLSAQEEKTLLETYHGTSLTSEQKSRYEIVKKLQFIGFIFFLYYIAHEQGQPNPSTPVQEWAYYLKTFADTRGDLTPQFYYEYGKSAQQRWESLPH